MARSGRRRTDLPPEVQNDPLVQDLFLLTLRVGLTEDNVANTTEASKYGRSQIVARLRTMLDSQGSRALWAAYGLDEDGNSTGARSLAKRREAFMKAEEGLGSDDAVRKLETGAAPELAKLLRSGPSTLARQPDDMSAVWPNLGVVVRQLDEYVSVLGGTRLRELAVKERLRKPEQSLLFQPLLICGSLAVLSHELERWGSGKTGPSSDLPQIIRNSVLLGDHMELERAYGVLPRQQQWDYIYLGYARMSWWKYTQMILKLHSHLGNGDSGRGIVRFLINGLRWCSVRCLHSTDENCPIHGLQDNAAVVGACLRQYRSGAIGWDVVLERCSHL